MKKTEKEIAKPLIIKAKRAKGDDGYRVFSIRVKEELINSVDKISEDTGRSRNELIGMFIEYALDKCVIDYGDISDKNE